MIFLLLCLLLWAALFMLTIWPIGPPPLVPTAVDATQGALFRLERWSDYWCLPLNPSKCEASFFFSVDPHQANLHPSLLLFNFFFRFNPTPTFLGVIFDRTLSFSKHVSLMKAKFFPRLKALRCISASSWVPSKESISLFCIKLFFVPFSLMNHRIFSFLKRFTNITKVERLHLAASRASPAASRRPLSHFFSPRLLYHPCESP